MVSPWDLDDPFAPTCDVCGQSNCPGHASAKKGIPFILISVIVVVALVAGSSLFFFSAGGSKSDGVPTTSNSVENSPISTDSSSTASIPTSSSSITDPSQSVVLTSDEKLMLDSVNAERAKASLQSLTWCPALARSATAHSADMAKNSYFEHESLDGREVADRAKAQGYDYQTVGENIAVGQRDVAEVMDGWMNSPGHRANILRATFTHFGSSVATGDFKGFESIYWTQNFGAGGNCQ